MARHPGDALMKRIGVISDTHGLLRPEAVAALRGSDLIIHAGDIGDAAVLESLRALAPVVAVRGNNDRSAWAARIPETEVVDVDGTLLYVIHDVHDLDLKPAAAGFRVVISGHSHRPLLREERGVLYLNPGSAGPRRFTLPIALARLCVERGRVDGQIVEL